MPLFLFSIKLGCFVVVKNLTHSTKRILKLNCKIKREELLMYLYQNRYANKLHLNIIRVKYSKEHTLIERDFAIKLNDNYTNTANDLITYKLYLYLGCLLSQNALRDNVITLDTKSLPKCLKKRLKRLILYHHLNI